MGLREREGTLKQGIIKADDTFCGEILLRGFGSTFNKDGAG